MTMRRFGDLSLFHAARPEPDDQPSEVLVIFVGQTECRYLWWLKKGFRHCFAAIRNGSRWIICDSLKNRIEFSLLDLPPDFDLGGFYHSRGYTVMIGRSAEKKKLPSFIPEILTCVTVVKRVLCIRSFWTLTPWQLFCFLNSRNDRWKLIE